MQLKLCQCFKNVRPFLVEGLGTLPPNKWCLHDEIFCLAKLALWVNVSFLTLLAALSFSEANQRIYIFFPSKPSKQSPRPNLTCMC